MKKTIIIIFCVGLSFSTFAQNEMAIKYASTITESDLHDHLSILASDALEGRETGERGQKMAAAFIAHKFHQLGLKPVVPENTSMSYYQKFDLISSRIGETYLSINGKKYNNGDGIIYKGKISSKGEISAPVVFAGFGSDEDLSEVNPVEKIVIINAIGGNSAIDRELSARAYEHGAELVILIKAEKKGEVNSILARNKSYYMGQSLGFKNTDKRDAGYFIISMQTAAEILKTKKEKLSNGVLKKRKEVSLSYYISQYQKTISTENVLGFLEGTDKKEEIVVITAHYDHIGRDGKLINNGADDDGSGTSSVLEIAEAFVKAKNEGHLPRRSILFMLVTAEEKGLLGSEYYADHPIFPLKNTVVDLNIDMVGRVDPVHTNNREFVYLVGSDKLSADLHLLSENINNTFTNLSLDYTYNDEAHPDRIYYRSDHWNFAKNNIPIIFYFNGIHADYHQPSDTIEKIEFDLLEKRARLVFHTAWEIANREQRLKADKNIK